MGRGFGFGVALAAVLSSGALARQALGVPLLLNNGTKTGTTTLSGTAPFNVGASAI